MPYSSTTATRLGLTALALCCLAATGVGVAAATSVAAAPQRIAVINLERAIYATAEAERRIAKLKSDEDYREQRETVEALQKAGQRLVTQLRKDESVLSEARQRELQRRITTAREDVEYALKKLQAMEQAVVEEVREELSEPRPNSARKADGGREHQHPVAPTPQCPDHSLRRRKIRSDPETDGYAEPHG